MDDCQNILNRFNSIEDRLSLFDRKYNGFYYWKCLRSFVIKELNNDGLIIIRNKTKINNRIKNMTREIASFHNNKRFTKKDFVFFSSGLRHMNFFESWGAFDKYDILLTSYSPLDNSISLGVPVFMASLKYVIKDKLGLFKRDKKEFVFLKKLLHIINKEFETCISIEKIEKEVNKYIVEYKELYPYFKTIFKKTKPKAFVVVCSYSRELYPAFVAAKDLDIEIVEFQHGTVINHLEYSFGKKNNNVPFPDYFLLFGDEWNKYIRLPASTKTVTVGFPYQEAELLKYDRLWTDERTVVFYPLYNQRFESFINDFSIIAASKGYRVLVKVHPKFVDRIKEIFPVLYKSSNVEIITDNKWSIYYWLKIAKHHVMASTTVAMEAMALDNLNICIALDFPHEQAQPVLDMHCGRGFYTVEELIDLIENPMKRSGLECERVYMRNSQKNVLDFFNKLNQS